MGSETLPSTCYILSDKSSTLRVMGMRCLLVHKEIYGYNKEERYSRVPRLSHTRYSDNGPRGNGDMQAAKRD